MGRYDGMKGLVLGVANDHSIAWSIAKELLAEGAEIGFSHLPDRPDDQRQRNRRRVALLTDDEPNAKFLVPMDVSSDEQIAAVMETAKAEFGTNIELKNRVFAAIGALPPFQPAVVSYLKRQPAEHNYAYMRESIKDRL